MSIAFVVGAIVLAGVFAPGVMRREALRIANPPDARATRVDDQRAILVNDPSICPVCGVVEAVRPYEIRTTGATPPAEAANADPNLVPRTAYRVTVRMEDGSYRTLSQPNRPAFKAGDRVRLADGTLVSR